MEQKEILTTEQKVFLDVTSEEKYLTDNYYLTGGTALSSFYLFHRLSEDLDFFIEKEEVNTRIIKTCLAKIQKKLKLKKVDFKETFGIHNFYFHFLNDEILKVDFSYYPFPRIEKGTKYKNIIVDSLYDIAVNKVHTIVMQPRARDFIDVYFIIKKEGFAWEKLVRDAKAKFDWHIDEIQLGKQLMKAIEVKDYPRMIKKVDHREWKDFFLAEAKKLKKDIFI
jgi:predicted nucleotidyltransferase component of viral defense system